MIVLLYLSMKEVRWVDIYPRSINGKSDVMNPSRNRTSSIMPSDIRIGNCSIMPNIVRGKNVTFPNGMILGIWGLIVLLILFIYIYSCCSFANQFERDWSRVEEKSGSYYELKLCVSNGKIEYKFDSWLINTSLNTYSYNIVMPGKVIIDGKMVDVEIKDDMMILSPSITSADAKEYWIK